MTAPPAIRMECFRCYKKLTEKTVHFWSRILNKPIPIDDKPAHNIGLVLTCADCQIDLALEHK